MTEMTESAGMIDPVTGQTINQKRLTECLALCHSHRGAGTPLVAVPVGSSVSEQGTVYVASDAGRAGGPVMALDNGEHR